VIATSAFGLVTCIITLPLTSPEDLENSAGLKIGQRKLQKLTKSQGNAFVQKNALVELHYLDLLVWLVFIIFVGM